jgi:hypothetical protein
MAILAQSGYGRGNKIDEAYQDDIIEGVIMSPRDERPDRLEASIEKWGEDFPDLKIFFDPQFYAATLNAPRDGHLVDYEYYSNNNALGRTHFSGSSIRDYVQQCIDYQDDTFGEYLTKIISPSILFDSFQDYWSQVAINLSVESKDYHSSIDNAPPLLITLAVSETAFQNKESVDEFLDAITELDVDGFYIIIRRNSLQLQHAIEPHQFARLLYFCHVLADLNDYELIVGYSDWHSFLLESVGVKYTACGWFQNLRQFSMARFQPSGGGRRPLKRYSSAPLLSCPLLQPELKGIQLTGIIDLVLSGSPYDHIIENDPAQGEQQWTDAISCFAHWFSLDSLSKRITAFSDTKSRVDEAFNILAWAQGLYRNLTRNGVQFQAITGPDHIAEWSAALEEFVEIAEI